MKDLLNQLSVREIFDFLSCVLVSEFNRKRFEFSNSESIHGGRHTGFP